MSLVFALKTADFFSSMASDAEDIISVTEAWISGDIHSLELSDNAYLAFRRDRGSSSNYCRRGGELKGAVEMTPTRIIGPPTTLINEAIFLPYHPSNEGKRLKPAVLGVKAKPADRPEPPG
ncbi:hypothetical protein AVEN_245440-1 [Araneus ventricosus]|uniref:Uncharacterized protein n=1 Tax=Araneus ventricosus TaxID=182803 RepID=A0A4Y2RCV2_ARAVE|nr:hypothetical protein AVEN_245440-1 [Araneus ventricosus]